MSEQQPVPFLAPVLGRIMDRAAAPATDAIRRVLSETTTEVHCPRCGKHLAVLVHRDRCLYRPGDPIGAVFATEPAQRVRVPCDSCQVSWQTSGRGVSRRVYKGLDPLI